MATRKIECSQLVIVAPTTEEANALLHKLVGRGDLHLRVASGIRLEVTGEAKREPKAKR